MHFPTLLTSLATCASLTWAHPPPYWNRNCLDDAQALDISTRWLSVFSTGGVTSKKQLATIVSQDLYSVDATFGAPTTNIDELWAAITAPGKYTTTDVKQTPIFEIHSCDQIGLHWQYKAVTTGYKSSVPKGTKVSFTGNDILHIDLQTGLISNATSCGDWILLAQQLGEDCNV